MTSTLDNLIVVRTQSEALIRSEMRAADQRGMLERAVVEAVNKMGATVDEVSEASGLPPREIRRLLGKPGVLDASLDTITGTL